MNVKKYRKKPVVIEAMKFDGTTKTGTPIIQWIIDGGSTARWSCNNGGECDRTEGGHHIAIDTLEGTMRAETGDYIIRGVQGEFYPVKPDIFEQTHEQGRVMDDATQKSWLEMSDAEFVAEVRSWPRVSEWDEPGLVDDVLAEMRRRLEAAHRPLVSPEQRDALDELIEGVLIAERDEWPRDPGDAPSEVLAGAVTDAILARFSLPVPDVEDERNALRAEVENLRGGYAASTEALDRFRDVVCEVTGYRENPGDDTMIAKLRSMHGLTGPEPTRWREFMVGARAARDQIIAHAAGAARHMERLTPTRQWCHARHACHHWWEDECSEACDRGEHAHPHGAAECSDRKLGGDES